MDREINSSSHYKKIQRKNLNIKGESKKEKLDMIKNENDLIKVEIIYSSFLVLLKDKEYNNLTTENKFHFRYKKAYSYNKKIKYRNQININNKKINYLAILLSLFLLNFSNPYDLMNIYSGYSNITIKLRGSGEQSIFFGKNYCWETAEIFTRPDEVYINDNKLIDIVDKYNFSEEENYVKLVWENAISNINCLFQNCYNIIEIDFSNFDFSLGIYGNMLFKDCYSLKSINFSKSEKITIFDSGSMFYECSSLISLNLSNFDMSQVTDIGYMFHGVKTLTSLDLSHFQTPNITVPVERLFSQCTNLEYINLKNAYFNIGEKSDDFISASKNVVFCTNDDRIKSKIKDYGCLVIDCSENWREKQKKINPDNNQCVDNCSLTVYKYDYKSKCYASCPNKTYNNNYICEDCHPDCKTCKNLPEINNTNCLSCLSPDKYLQFGNCVLNCTNGYYNDENDNSIKVCKCDLKKCYKCTRESFKKNLCISCNEGYFPKYNEINNDNTYIDCYKSPEGYYLDIYNKEPVYKECYESCKICNISGNETYHNCIKCKSNYSFEINYNYYKNCYNNCSYFHYLEKYKNINLCTETEDCPEEYNKLIYNKRECIKKCEEDDEYKYEFRKRCYKHCPEGSIQTENYTSLNKYYCKAVCSEDKPFEILLTQECVEICTTKDLINNLCILNFKTDDKTEEEKEDLKLQEILIKNAEKDFTSDGYNTSNLDKGEDEIIKDEKTTITLTTTNNQRNKINSNETVIDLGECETLLRKEYNISDNESLYIVKIDVIQKDMKIPKIGYNVYSKLFGENLIKLNLTVCESNKIDILLPVEISESLDKLNSSSEYYNDICYATTSNFGTDISLNDRKIEFIEGNKTVCQEDCIFSEYDDLNKKAKCSCKVKESSFDISDMKINKTKLFENIIDIKNIANFNIMICYKVLFNKKGIINNIAFYLNIIILIFHLIAIIIFYTRQKYDIDKKIKDITFGINNWGLVLANKKEHNNMKKKSSVKKGI